MKTAETLVTFAAALLLLLVGAMVISYGFQLGRDIRDRRRIQKWAKSWQEAFDRRQKPTITRVGKVERRPDGNIALLNWEWQMDCPCAPRSFGPQGQALVYNYTLSELEYIAQHPEEFQ
jgi:hypothetical protein